jgi:Cu-processing system permease protein
MSTLKIIRYQLRDVFRSRWIFFYGFVFLISTDALFRFGGTGDSVILSLLNLVLIVIPLVSIVLGTMYVYSSREYIELILTQPIRRRSLFAGLFVGLSLPLVCAFTIGVGLPFLFHGALTGGAAAALGLLLFVGGLLTVIFVALAFLIALVTEDRIKGLGAALVTWIFFAIVYNGLVLLAIQLFSVYPLHRPVIGMTVLNPIDLGRVLILLQLDVAVLMGFTGAVFERFFGSSTGRMISLAALFVWLAVPLALGRFTFLRKNF